MNVSGSFKYRPGYLVGGEAEALLQVLWRELAWRSVKIRMFGRELPQPRLTAWCSDPGIAYRYSGLEWLPEAWHPALDALRCKLQGDTGHRFNSVLANAYRDGRDSMGWHADDEPELGQCPVIASVSLGETRGFLVRERRGGSSQRIDLENGSLLMMQGDSQAGWVHSVPKTRRPVGLRINLTFRLVLGN